MKRRKWLAVLLAVAMTGSLAACSSSGSGTSEGSETDESSDSSVITVRVAGTPDYDPYTYVDEDDNITGYDIEVIRAIDELAPEIECEYSYTQWDTLLPGLDADRYDVVTNQLGITDEREEMYLYPQVPFLFCGSAVISSADEPLDTLEDLEGKTVGAIVGSSFTTQLEEYLDEHPDAFTLQYLDGTLPQMLEEIVNGRVDATFNDPSAAHDRAAIIGIEDRLHISEEIYNGGFSYFLFAKTDKGQEIADIFDKYLPELYYNGTLEELANEYLGTTSGVTSMPANGVFEEATLEEYQAAHES